MIMMIKGGSYSDFMEWFDIITGLKIQDEFTTATNSGNKTILEFVRSKVFS